jgi:hypothetical protein
MYGLKSINKKGYLVLALAVLIVIMFFAVGITIYTEYKESIKIKSFCENKGLIFDPDNLISHSCYKKEDSGVFTEYKIIRINGKFELIKE